MNHHELSLILLDSIRELVNSHADIDTSKLLAETYLNIMKKHKTCVTKEEDTFKPEEIICLGTLVYHLSNSKTNF